jgi:hypothetical protein
MVPGVGNRGMSIDIGDAFSEGFSRTVSRNGLLLAVAFTVVALVSVALSQTFAVELMDRMLEWIQGISPEEAGLSQQEYQEQLDILETERDRQVANSPLALGLPLGVTAAGMLAVALLTEALSMVAVRVFAAADVDAVSGGDLTGGLALATLNGFVGGIVVWGLIFVGIPLLLVPAIFFAVVFYFLRQEIALKNKNFVQALADSWRLTKGHRIEVFALGAVVVIVSQVGLIGQFAVGVVSTIGGIVVGAVLGGFLAAFGAAVVTQAYVQLDRDQPVVEEDGGEPDQAEDDPYNAALGPDDIPE